MSLSAGHEQLRAAEADGGEAASSRSDGELVRASLGDPKAYALIVRRYEPPLKRYLGRLLSRNSQQLEDVLQEVFLKVYINLNDYDQARSFSPWVYRIAHNEAISALRKRRAEPQLVSGEDGRLLLERIVESRDPHEPDAGQVEDRLRAEIARLDRRYRDVIVLRFLEERTYEEISDILQLPMGTVATLVSRGKERLRRALDIKATLRTAGASR